MVAAPDIGDARLGGPACDLRPELCALPIHLCTLLRWNLDKCVKKAKEDIGICRQIRAVDSEFHTSCHGVLHPSWTGLNPHETHSSKKIPGSQGEQKRQKLLEEQGSWHRRDEKILQDVLGDSKCTYSEFPVFITTLLQH